MNYLRPDIKRGNITPEEDDLIIRMHSLLGNRWSLIAGRLPGRTDNEIKNHWNTHLSKRLRNQGTDPITHKKLSSLPASPDRNHASRKKLPRKKKKGKARENGAQAEKDELEKKTIVYLPKPIRISACLSSSIPRSDSNQNLNSFDSNSASGSTSQEKKGNAWGENNNNNNYSDYNYNYTYCGDEEDQGFVGLLEEEHELVNGSDMEGQSEFPTSAEQHGTLEKLYEEYFQLLNNQESQEELESFAESLLV